MTTLALYGLVDTLWVARLGHEAIAALTIIMPYHWIFGSIAIGTGIGINALVSRRFGEKNIEAANHAAGQIYFIAALLGVVYLLVALLLTESVLILCGATPDIMDYGTQYLMTVAFGTPFLFFFIIADNLLRGSGEAIKPMIFMVASTVMNIILDPFFIFGIGPFPEMGVQGAALATVISNIAGAGLCFYYINVTRDSAYQIKIHNLTPSISILRDIYRVGLPAVIMNISESLLYIVFNNVLSQFGSIALAVAGIIMRIFELTFLPAIGASMGLLPIVGFCFGAGLWTRLWRAVRLSAIYLVSIMGVVTVLIVIFARHIVGIFSQDPELTAIAVPAIWITMSVLAFVGGRIIFNTTFQGLSKGKTALFLSLIQWVGFFLPLVFVLPKILGLTGVWLSMALPEPLAFLVSGLWLFREYRLRQRKNTLSEVPVPEVVNQ